MSVVIKTAEQEEEDNKELSESSKETLDNIEEADE